jgi:hypothetical protein
MATAAAVADDPVVELRTCRVCTETKPLDQFVRTNGGGFLHKCRPCRNTERSAEYHRRLVERDPRLSSSTVREKQARMREALGHNFVRYAPDPAIPRLLGDCLRDSRRVGLPFAVAWSEDVEFVIARIRARGGGIEAERVSWREAFEDTRAKWQASYNRVDDGPSCRLDHALADELAGERRDNAVIG